MERDGHLPVPGSGEELLQESDNPVAVLLSDDQRRDQTHRVAVADVNENAVVQTVLAEVVGLGLHLDAVDHSHSAEFSYLVRFDG